MLVNADVDEADIGNVRIHQNVTFTVDAFPDETFRGTVANIYLHPSVSANVVTYTTLINVDNKEMKLKPGMTASIMVYTEEDSNALLIPAKALSFKPDTAALKNFIIRRAAATFPDSSKILRQAAFSKKGAGKNKSPGSQFTWAHVWVRNEDTLEEKRILTGINDETNVSVIKGLSEGEEVITNVMTADKETDNTQRSPFMPQMRRSTPASQQGHPQGAAGNR
jgi:HlyD family secretion protein